jgi:transcriptional regulator with XRE-family HTH domain
LPYNQKETPHRTELINARGAKTQTDIAKLCGVTQQTYSHWETGRATPPIKKMILLERILNVPKEQLFYDVFHSKIEYNEQAAAFEQAG